MTSHTATIRARFEDALAGRPIRRPVYAVYDWFVEHRPIDWRALFDQGLGRINHATVVTHRRPHVEITETESTDPQGRTRRDVRWVTEIGELHEWYLGEWRQEHLIKRPEDYRIMARALSDVEVAGDIAPFERSEAAVAENGITIAVPEMNRTALQKIQIDFAGLERFSCDLALGTPELMELIELMNDLTVRDFQAVASLSATPTRGAPAPRVRYVKLWENLTIETMGPAVFRRRLAPVYERILDILSRAGQKLLVHYDGKLRLIADDIAHLAIDGLDSLTPAPEGDLSAAEGRRLWPDKFLWLHPPLGWFRLPEPELLSRIREMVRAAGPTRYCLMISEDVPPNWEQAVPRILGMLREWRG